MRQTSEQIDAEIIDVAARLFAVHGVDRTSIQQIADAVGYSKTGLLHRFPSKQALLTAVEEVTSHALSELTALARQVPADRRPADAVATIVDRALAHPGVVLYLQRTLMVTLVGQQPQLKTELDMLVEQLVGPAPTPERMLRTLMAMSMIADGAAHAAQSVTTDLPLAQIRLVLIDAAIDVVNGVTDLSHQSPQTARLASRDGRTT